VIENRLQTTAVKTGETDTHTFIITLWLEEQASGAEGARWRGHITHVLGGERRYIEDLGNIVTFIVPYLNRMGVRPPFCWQIRSWLEQRKPHFWQR
jgi:hypothetical protein